MEELGPRSPKLKSETDNNQSKREPRHTNVSRSDLPYVCVVFGHSATVRKRSVFPQDATDTLSVCGLRKSVEEHENDTCDVQD